jgi:hypothetical protein
MAAEALGCNDGRAPRGGSGGGNSGKGFAADACAWGTAGAIGRGTTSGCRQPMQVMFVPAAPSAIDIRCRQYGHSSDKATFAPPM